MPISDALFRAGVPIFLILLVISAMFYGFSAALMKLNDYDLEEKAKSGDEKAKKLLAMKERPARHSAAVPILVILTSFWLSAVFFALIGRLGAAPALLALGSFFGLLAACFFMTLLFMTMRRLGSARPWAFARGAIAPVRLFSALLSPLTLSCSYLSGLIASLFGAKKNPHELPVSEREIISIVDEAHEQGVIEQNEAEMIQNIITFNETQVQDIMTHRKDIVAFEENTLLQNTTAVMAEEGFSRYPVYRDDLDNVVGVIHYKDAMTFQSRNSWARFTPLSGIPGLIREAVFVPQTRSINDLFRFMQAGKIHMAVILDEYGQTAGLISMEDILEEIVGEIMDEYDEEDPAFRTQKDDSLVIDALAPLSDVGEKLGIDFSREMAQGFETLNGFLTNLLGHIPTSEDLDRQIPAKGYTFTILTMGSRTLGEVRAQKGPQRAARPEHKET